MKLSKNFVLISLFAIKSGVWALPTSGSATASSVATATRTGAMSTKNTSTAVAAAAVTQKPKGTPSSTVTAKATSTPGSAPINRSTNYRKHGGFNGPKDKSGRAARSKAFAYPNARKGRGRSPTRGAMNAARNRPSRGRNYVTSKAGGTSGPGSRGPIGGRTSRSKPRAARKQDSLHGSQNAQKKVTANTANRRVVSKPPASTTSSQPSGPKPTAVAANKNGGTTSARGSASVVKKANPSPVSNVAATSNANAKASALGKATTSVPRVTSTPKPAPATRAPTKPTTSSHRPAATLAGSAADTLTGITTDGEDHTGLMDIVDRFLAATMTEVKRTVQRTVPMAKDVPAGSRGVDLAIEHRFSSHKGEFEGGQQPTATQTPISTATPTATQTQ
ncbi:hypothetical protein H1R20_g11844, partial [Candolleomyces eurysporus]